MKIRLKLWIVILIFAADMGLGVGLFQEIRAIRWAHREVSTAETRESMEIALTFDDGPNAKYTPALLDGLRARGIQVSFFLIGKRIEGNEDIVKQMQADGHLIGNHTYSHVRLTKESPSLACSEIEETNEIIYRVTGEYPSYIRPPFGAWNEELTCLVPMTVVLWNVDPMDWKVKNARKVEEHILKQARASSIVLLHDSSAATVEATLDVIDSLAAKGYTFVTVDELMID